MPGNDVPATATRPFPTYRLLGIFVALLTTYAALQIWLTSLGPVQSFYLGTYARLSVVPNLTRAHWSIGRGVPGTPTFPVLFAGDRVATEVTHELRPGSLFICATPVAPAAFREWLKGKVYGRRTIVGLLQPVIYSAETCLVVFFLIGRYVDRRRMRTARRGQLLRGPALVSRCRFNWQTRGDGVAFELSNRRNAFELLQGNAGRLLRIRRDREAHHIQIAGDTGAGKSTLIRQILKQIAGRPNEVAIVFDPDREYIQEFFNEERGDWVLNPLDDRCPYWALENEAMSEAEAASIALGLWPDEAGQQPFFKKHPRAIFAYLISRYNAVNSPKDCATCENLAHWLACPRQEVTPRIAGTRHAVSTDANAKDQSQGLWAVLGEAATPLQMMPRASEDRRIWTVRNYAKERKGWIFITSTPDTIEALRPVQSLWLDMLILRLQTEPEPGQARVWMVLDELASLNALPQLLSALTKQRKSDNPIVLGFQGMSQLDALYGKKAETILSQAFSNFVLRTREPRASKHLSDLIGRAQLERLRETKPARWLQWQQGSYSTERVMDPVVMDSQIQGLDDLNGYFVQKDKIVLIRFRPQPKENVAKPLIERAIPPVEAHPEPADAPVITASGQQRPEEEAAGQAAIGLSLFQ